MRRAFWIVGICLAYAMAGRNGETGIKSVGAYSEAIQLINRQSGEKLLIPSGRIPAPSVLNRFLRCASQKRYTLMDPRLILMALQAAYQFGKTRVEIVSAFRTSLLNEALRAENHRVALRSRHINGQALDLRIPEVETQILCDYFQNLRVGGVGCYVRLGFVHIDVGPVRFWAD